ncbi:MAG: DNA internalization-related competence protein ComEC/Rec2 [Lachnospiraceae bacterium]|nr:DNA internalization-related competence protein ComEC/Rec2 [Lachnospiraceae bacterium]
MTRRPLMSLCILIVALLALTRALGTALVPPPSDVVSAKKWTNTTDPVRVTGFVAESETREDFSYLILKRAVLSADAHMYELNKVRVTLKNPQQFAVGSFLCAEGILREPEPASNDGQFDRKSYYRMLGIYYTMGNADIEILDDREDPVGEALRQIRFRLRRRIEESFSPRTAAVMSAMLVGDRSLMEAEDSDRFRMAGVSHVLVISGLHITMMAEFVYRILCRLAVIVPVRRQVCGSCERMSRKNAETESGIIHDGYLPDQSGCRHRQMLSDREMYGGKNLPVPEIRILHMNKKIASVITMLLLTACAVMTGLSVSTVRAVFMYCLAAGARITGRTYDPPTGVSLTAAVILIANPEYLTYSGFQLSFLAVVILGLCSDRGPLMRGVILYLGTVPFVLWNWYEIPLYSVFLNMLVVPLVPFILGTGIPGILFGRALGGLFCLPAEGLVKLLYFVLRSAGRLPFASLICGRPEPFRILIYGVLLAGFVFLSVRWRTDKKRFLLIGMIPLLLVLFLVRGRSGLEIHMLDIGQGDSIVVEMPGGQNILIDGGSTTVSDVGRYRILPFLKYEGIRKLDYIFVTHTDLDHINGIMELFDMMADGTTSLRADTLVMPYLREKGEAWEELCAKAEKAGMRVIRVRAGDAFHFYADNAVKNNAAGGTQARAAEGGLPDVSLTILGPDPGRETAPVNANAQCIVAAMTFGKFDCLLTGDVVEEGEENLLGILERTGREFEVLKVAHHGSKYSTPEKLLQIIRPDLCLISAGRYNRYGHPHAELLDRLYAAGADVRITRYGGELSVVTDGEKYHFRAYDEDKYTEETYVCK